MRVIDGLELDGELLSETAGQGRRDRGNCV